MHKGDPAAGGATPFIERKLRLLSSGDGQRAPSQAVLLGDLANRPAIVLLGDPGAGKSTLFRHESERVPNSRCLSVRGFLNLPASELQASTLFLDGLDEARSGDGDPRDALDHVVRRLVELGRPPFRLSCRGADWLAGIDLHTLTEALGDIVQVDLLPLSGDDIRAIVRGRLADPEPFLQSVRAQGMDEWLGNPQTLELLLAAAKHGPLPANRTQLFTKACETMAEERNPHHRLPKSRPSMDKILDLAGRLCSMMLLGGFEGVASELAAADEGFLPLDRLTPRAQLRAALGTRLFSWNAGEGRARPVHRMVAEWLAARHLLTLVRKGLPLVRLMSLITGHDGGTLSDLRGLYAWLATLSPADEVILLVHADPVALVIYGDPAVLPASAKRALLCELQEWASGRDPWFLQEGSGRAYGTLADPALALEFRAILSDPERPVHLQLAILAALAQGPPLRELAGDLLVLVRSGRQASVRQMALHALTNGIAAHDELLSLLEEIQTGRLADEGDELRGELLDHLFPAVLSAGQLVAYLTRPSNSEHHGALEGFLGSLTERTPDDMLPELLDALAAREPLAPSFARPTLGGLLGFSWDCTLGGLLRRGLELCGKRLEPERLWSWLQRGSGAELIRYLGPGDQQAIRAWFTAHLDRLTALYEWWMTIAATSDPSRRDFDFWRTTHAAVPFRFWRFQLSLAEPRIGGIQGEMLFRAAWKHLWYDHEPSAAEVAEFWAWTERRPEVAGLIEELRVFTLPESYLDPAAGGHNEAGDAAKLAANRALILESLPQVRLADSPILDGLARLFLDPRDRGGGVGLDRIAHDCGAEVAAAAAEGFVAALSRPALPSPAEIGTIVVEDQHPGICAALAAGMELLHAEGTTPRLAEGQGPRSALAYALTERALERSEWPAEVIRQEPEAAAVVAREAWTAFLDRDSPAVPYLGRLGSSRPAWHPLAHELGLTLLRLYPMSNANVLSDLMSAALVGAAHHDLASVVRSQLRQLSHLDRPRAALWLALGLIVTPETTLRKAQTYLRTDGTGKAHELVHALRQLSDARSLLALLSSPDLAAVVRLLGARCQPEPIPPDGWTVGAHPFESALFVSKWMRALADRTDDDAVAGLQNLGRSRSLIAWREQLLTHAQAQSRKVREERYQKLSLEAIVHILDNGPPASAADLSALAVDHLRTLARRLRHAAGDTYKTYWNLDGHRHPVKPVPENAARDRLAESLRLAMKPQQVAIEHEAQYADETRADLKLIHGHISLPVEVKRNDRRDLWTAPRTQLRDRYASDPAAEGHGIYLVFWFGEDASFQTPKPPGGISRPRSAADLETALRTIYSGAEWQGIEFICLDCSRRGKPPGKRPRRPQTGGSRPARLGSKHPRRPGRTVVR